MKLYSALRATLVAAAMLAGPALAQAQVITCNLTTPCGGPPACRGCTTLSAVYNGNAAPCSASGGINLIGTEYEATCAGVMSPPGCTVKQPPMRFWLYDFYSKANSGCQDPTTAPSWWMVNAAPDDGASIPPGHWYMWQPGWSGTDIDSCYSAVTTAPEFRTVVEIADVDRLAGREGTANHGAWYVLMSVPLMGQFDFDRITGGTGCTPNEVVKQPVEGVTISGRSSSCAGTPAVRTQSSTLDATANFFDVNVTLVNPNPKWWNESGQNGTPALIAGYQIMYKTGPMGGGGEPTTSALGTWLPVRMPGNASMTLPVQPLNTSGPITVAVPITNNTTDYYFATRLVYVDATENPLGSYDPNGTAPVGPQVTSPVSSHCGPAFYDTVVNPAVEFGSVTAERTPQGVNVRWTTLREDDTNGFRIFRSTDAAGTEALADVSGLVDSRGANFPYVATDAGAANGTAYYYYVQEITSNGLGDRSQAVRVEAVATGSGRGGASGGRNRGRHD